MRSLFKFFLLVAFTLLLNSNGIDGAAFEICPGRIVGYHEGKEIVQLSAFQGSKLTHYIYTYIEVNANGELFIPESTVTPSFCENDEACLRRDIANLYSKAPITAGRLWETSMLARRTNPNMKLLFSIGGPLNSEHLPTVMSSEAGRTKLVNSIMKFMLKFYLNGVEISWRYPVKGGKTGGTPADKQNFVLFLQKLRTELNKFQHSSNPLLIAVDAPSELDIVEAGFDLPGIAPHVDFITVKDFNEGGDLHKSMKYFACRVGAKKLNMEFSLRNDSAARLREKGKHISDYAVGGLAIWPSIVDYSHRNSLFNVSITSSTLQLCPATSRYDCGEDTTTTTTTTPASITGACNDCRDCKPSGESCYNCCVDPSDGRGDKYGCTNCRHCRSGGPCTNCCAGARSGCNNCVNKNLGNCC